jgi:hypothetical protein
VFLDENGVEPTNNQSQRALKFGLSWRKRSHGTQIEKDNRWVERILSLKQTCRDDCYLARNAEASDPNLINTPFFDRRYSLRDKVYRVKNQYIHGFAN